MLVVSQPDKRRHRKSAPEASPVKAAAAARGLPVSDRVADVAASGAEIGVVVAFGRLIPPAVLRAVPLVNVHFSLLPRWRGAAPVERAILAGDTETGVTLMAVDEGLDTGPVYDRRTVAIGPSQSADELRDELSRLGVEMLVARLAGGRAGLGTPVPQHGEATYAEKVSVEEMRVDWRRTAGEIDRLVRVGHAWTTCGGERLAILAARPDAGCEGGCVDAGVRVDAGSVACVGDRPRVVVTCGTGCLDLVTVRAQSRSAVSALDWWRGARLANGAVLGA